MYSISKNGALVEIDTAFRKAATVDKRIVNQLRQNSRALPALAGSMLGWDSGVIQWEIGMPRRRRAACADRHRISGPRRWR